MSWTDLPDFTELLLRLGCAREQIRDARHKPEKIDGLIPTAPGKILHQLQLVHPEGLGVKALAEASAAAEVFAVRSAASSTSRLEAFCS